MKIVEVGHVKRPAEQEALQVRVEQVKFPALAPLATPATGDAATITVKDTPNVLYNPNEVIEYYDSNNNNHVRFNVTLRDGPNKYRATTL